MEPPNSALPSTCSLQGSNEGVVGNVPKNNIFLTENIADSLFLLSLYDSQLNYAQNRFCPIQISVCACVKSRLKILQSILLHRKFEIARANDRRANTIPAQEIFNKRI